MCTLPADRWIFPIVVERDGEWDGEPESDPPQALWRPDGGSA